MIEQIKQRQNALLVGLADLFVQKEQLETRIDGQKIAIQELGNLIKTVEEPSV